MEEVAMRSSARHRLVMAVLVGIVLTISAAGTSGALISSTMTKTLDPFDGDPVTVQVTHDDIGGSINVTAETIGPNTGGIVALFFNLADESLLPGLSVTGSEVTDQALDANNVTKVVVSYSKLNVGPWDTGIAIGQNGRGASDDDFSP